MNYTFVSESGISTFLKIVWHPHSPSREQASVHCNASAFQEHRLLN